MNWGGGGMGRPRILEVGVGFMSFFLLIYSYFLRLLPVSQFLGHHYNRRIQVTTALEWRRCGDDKLHKITILILLLAGSTGKSQQFVMHD